jgi:hypothetical protein
VVRIEIDDPQIKLSIEGHTATITNADKQPITLTPGKHGLTIARGDFIFNTAAFEMAKRGRTSLKITWHAGQKMEVAQDGMVIGEKAVPPLAVAAGPAKGVDPPSDYAGLATGPWIALFSSEEEYNRLRKAKGSIGPEPNFASGVLECTGGRMFFAPLPTKNAIVRARMKKLGQWNDNVGLSFRYANGEVVTAWFNGGGCFGIGKGGFGQWQDLTSCKLLKNYDDYFEFTFAAVGHKLTAYADGQKILETHYDLPAGASVAAGVGGKGLFRNIEVQLLDMPAASTSKFKNDLGMEFVLVSKGKSWLGGGDGRSDDKEVEIAHDFYLGKFEVTQGEWQKVMGTNPSQFSRTGGDKEWVKDISEQDLKRFPVENVSWEDCQVFIKRVNEQAKQGGVVVPLAEGGGMGIRLSGRTTVGQA